MVLFDGGDLSGWCSPGERDAAWRVRDGCLEVVPGTGDLCTRAVFGDFQLHVEFCVPADPAALGQSRGNSGVYLQGRYELQILDSFGMEATAEGCGALYKVHAPLWNACRKPGTWQTFDVAFRAPVLDTNGLVFDHARATVFHNGVMIHDNVGLHGPTRDAIDPYEAQPGPLRLEDHGSPVKFRNIWVVPVSVREL